MSDIQAIGGALPRHEAVASICERHGPYEGWRMVVMGREVLSACPDCMEEHKQRELREDEERRHRERAERRQRMVEAKLSMAGIPARFRACSFDTFRVDEGADHGAQQHRALAACRAYAANWQAVRERGAVLVLTGGPGTGKTHLACAIANALIREHLVTVTFGTVADYVRGVRDTYRKDSQRSERDAIRALTEPDLLIMDELGQRASEYDQAIMFDVLNARYADMRPMVLLSNLARPELEAALGERMADRLRDVGAFVAMNWPSRRGRKA